MKKRYSVMRCDECGTLDNCPRDVTWDVVDTTNPGAEGYATAVSNHATRAAARREAAALNANR